jgi:spermidine synthase
MQAVASSSVLPARGIDPRAATRLLALSMFFTGAAGYVYQIILATVSTYVLGNSIEQFAVVGATMLLAMGAGTWSQRYVSDQNLVEKFILLELGITVVGAFAPTLLYASFAYVENHFVLIQYSFVVLIGFMVGLEIPVVLRLNQRFAQDLKTNVATVYGYDYAGAFVGALLWTWYLLKVFSLTEISYLVSLSNFVVATLTFVYFVRHGWVKWPRVISVLLVVTLGALSYGYNNNRDWSAGFEQKMYADPIIQSTTTRYQRIVVTRNTKLNDYRLYLNGNLQFSSVDEKRYHEMLVHPAMSAHGKAEHVLVLGGGDGLAVREILKYPTVKTVTLVDLDPGMIELARTDPVLMRLNAGALTDARVLSIAAPVQEIGVRMLEVAEQTVSPSDRRTRRHVRTTDREPYAQVTVITMDADLFVRKVDKGKPYDVIISDLPDPNSIELVKLYSREFYRAVRSVLAENGIFVAQSTSPFHAKEAFLCIKRTIEAAGFETVPYHENIPSFGDWGWVMAWNKEREAPNLKQWTPHVLMDYVTPDVVSASMVFGKNVLSSKRWDVNTRLNPVLLQLYADGWQVD